MLYRIVNPIELKNDKNDNEIIILKNVEYLLFKMNFHKNGPTKIIKIGGIPHINVDDQMFIP